MDISQNILKWYPFRENSSVLEIYDEKSILTKINKNIQIDTCNIKNIRIDGLYDYITLIGTFEYAPIILEEEKCYSSFLSMLRNHLKPNGIIIIAIDNRLGVKYLTGAKSSKYSYIFEGMESKIQKGKPNLLLKQEITKFIKEAGFKNFKFYYPLPDYKFTSSIFSDEFLPTSDHSKILYPVKYEEGSMILYNEINILKQICDMGEFEKFTNSYLVEISDNEIENNTQFVNYNIFRKDKYKLLLTINGNKVQKVAENDEANTHIEKIKSNIAKLKELGFNVLEEVKENKIISEFVKEKELDKLLIETIEQKDTNTFKEKIKDWYEYIKEKLTKNNNIKKDVFEKYNIKVPDEIKNMLTFVENGYIDLAFENVFYKDGYLLYDQEWYLENVPLEFILYRSINNLYTYNSIKLERKISKEEIYGEFNLKQYEVYFEELEKKIQDEILDKTFVEKYQNEIGKYYKRIENFKTEIKQKEEEIEQKERKIEEIQRSLEEIINAEQMKYKELENTKNEIEKKYNELLHEYNTSRGWKVIKTIRKVVRKK